MFLNKLRNKASVVFIVAIVFGVLLFRHMGTGNMQYEISSYSTKRNHFQLRAMNMFLNLLNYRDYPSATDGYIMKSLMKYSLPQTKAEFFAEVLNDTASQDTNRTLLLEYRKEFVEGSTAVGLPQNMFCTKENTNVDETFNFLKSLGTATITHDLWNLFPETSLFDDKRRYKKCNIIGNSGILLNSKCGKQIDDADFILRCNLPILKGFEDDVGVHTDLVTIAPSIFRESLSTEASKREFLETLSDFDGAVWVQAFIISATWSMAVKAAHLDAAHKQKMYFGHPENSIAVNHLWRSVGHPNPITTGFYMTTSFMNICEETHLYGFWPFAETANGTHVNWHYHNSVDPFFSWHDNDDEFRMLWRLHQLNLLKLHFGPCS
ncbi:alpha-N-acetylneuraminide alpha-2,8-sialyltransferase-like isoform X2 [Amphiura filiformis]|uniref:alpha-N-acetylneuraminide alpha-2,8-sialyltransferase-like isoform X2 n=1 Tax=Amphiura filiformis TaxID=82378 RepID=UPI003B21345B